uniref:Uncharacterized protein n=1 Tax=Avena sativa TaxID=4498 RepID=A0ACD5ZR53_AVESA
MARFAAVPLVFLVILAFFAVSGAARRLGGDVWAPEGEAVAGGDGVMAQLLRQMYLQRLGAGPSCGTHSANGGCPSHP